jgi:hypothetical protein
MTLPGFGFSSISSISLDGLPFGNIPFSTYFAATAMAQNSDVRVIHPFDKNIRSGTENE